MLLPIAARRLTPEEYGVYSLLLAATNLIHLLFELGLVTALIKFHAESPDAADRRRLRSLLLLGMPAIDLVLAAPLLLFRDAASAALFGTPEHGGLVAIVVSVVSIRRSRRRTPSFTSTFPLASSRTLVRAPSCSVETADALSILWTGGPTAGAGGGGGAAATAPD